MGASPLQSWFDMHDGWHAWFSGKHDSPIGQSPFETHSSHRPRMQKGEATPQSESARHSTHPSSVSQSTGQSCPLTEQSAGVPAPVPFVPDPLPPEPPPPKTTSVSVLHAGAVAIAATSTISPKVA
jgi:hypothetical protein